MTSSQLRRRPARRGFFGAGQEPRNRIKPSLGKEPQAKMSSARRRSITIFPGWPLVSRGGARAYARPGSGTGSLNRSFGSASKNTRGSGEERRSRNEKRNADGAGDGRRGCVPKKTGTRVRRNGGERKDGRGGRRAQCSGLEELR